MPETSEVKPLLPTQTELPSVSEKVPITENKTTETSQKPLNHVSLHSEQAKTSFHQIESEVKLVEDPDSIKRIDGERVEYHLSILKKEDIDWDAYTKDANLLKKTGLAIPFASRCLANKCTNLYRRYTNSGFLNNCESYYLENEIINKMHEKINTLWDENKGTGELEGYTIEDVHKMHLLFALNDNGTINLNKELKFVVIVKEKNKDSSYKKDKNGNFVYKTIEVFTEICENTIDKDNILVFTAEVMGAIDTEKLEKIGPNDSQSTTKPDEVKSSQSPKQVADASKQPADSSNNCWLHAGSKALQNDPAIKKALDTLDQSTLHIMAKNTAQTVDLPDNDPVLDEMMKEWKTKTSPDKADEPLTDAEKNKFYDEKLPEIRNSFQKIAPILDCLSELNKLPKNHTWQNETAIVQKAASSIRAFKKDATGKEILDAQGNKIVDMDSQEKVSDLIGPIHDYLNKLGLYKIKTKLNNITETRIPSFNIQVKNLLAQNSSNYSVDSTRLLLSAHYPDGQETNIISEEDIKQTGISLAFQSPFKDEKRIALEVSLTLDLIGGKFTPNANNTGAYKFKYAIIHEGTSTGGHYKTLCRENDKWYLYDNQKSIPEEITDKKRIQDLLSNAVYVHYDYDTSEMILPGASPTAIQDPNYDDTLDGIELGSNSLPETFQSPENFSGIRLGTSISADDDEFQSARSSPDPSLSRTDSFQSFTD